MALELTDDQAQRLRARFIVAGLRAGLSANAIIANFVGTPLGQRRSTLLEQISQYQGVPGPITSVPEDLLNQYLSENQTINYPSRGPTRYQYVYTVDATNLNTGEVSTITYSLVSPTRLIPEIANAYAQAKVDFGASNLQADFDTLELLDEYKFSNSAPLQ